jgi:hypothetical protein
LSETGLYLQIATQMLADGVIEYAPRYELWSDGASKRRFFSLPAGTQIDTRDADHWVFPVGTRVWKEFSRNGRRIETRLLQKVAPGPMGWWEVAYHWRADLSDADAVPDGVDNASQTAHHIPSQTECVQCHAGVRDVLIGLSTLQLATPSPRAMAQGDGGTVMDAGDSSVQIPTQLDEFVARGWLSVPPAERISVPGQGDTQQALAYMHANCAHCHNSEGWFASEVALRLSIEQGMLTPEQTGAYRTAINARMFHTVGGTTLGIVPGDPTRSQLYVRMTLRDLEAMPPVCTQLVDPDGLALIRRWISSLR